jgi:hypothetical protein
MHPVSNVRWQSPWDIQHCVGNTFQKLLVSRVNWLVNRKRSLFSFQSYLQHTNGANGLRPPIKDGSRSGSGRISTGFGSCGFRFGDDFSPTVFGFGFGFGIGFSFGFGFSPVDIQWISEINHLKLKPMFYNMLIITCLLILLKLFKIDS